MRHLADLALAFALAVPTMPVAAVPSGLRLLVESDFTGEGPGVNTPWTQTWHLDPAVLFGGWERGPGATGVATIDDAFGFFVTAGESESTLGEAIADGEYLSCTVGPAPDETLDLGGAQMRFSIRRLEWHAPRRYSVLTSLGGFTDEDALFTATWEGSGDFDIHDLALFFPNDEAYDGVTAPIEIRLYAHGANWNGHETSLTAFRLATGVTSRTLTLTAGPGGSARSEPDRRQFEDGETVRLFALPDTDHRFAGWTGDVVGLGNPRTLVMDADRAVMAHFEPLAPPHQVLATNLGGIVDWSTAWPFVDVYKRSRTWQTRNIDGSGDWNSGHGDRVPVDADGWPVEVPFDPGGGAPLQIVHTVLVTVNEPGPHTFLYEGEGTLRFHREGGSWETLPTGGVRSHEFVMPAGGSVFIEILATAPPPDHLRRFRIVHDDYLATFETDPFHPLHLERLTPFTVLRFMDWGRTNGSPLVRWEDRTRPEHATQARAEGAALEHMIDLANTLGVDAWICIPHAADDDYVRAAAALARDTLGPSLRLYVEYSNETWNTAGPFTQTRYVQDQGERLELDPNRWVAGQKFVALRSVQIWTLVAAEFGTEMADRVVKVMATHSANISTTHLRVAAMNDPVINPDAVSADVLAIAPYFGRSYTPDDLPPNAPAYPTVDEILDEVAPARIVEITGHVAAQRQVANEQGWDLVCYEAGQHFVGTQGAENDDTLTAILHAANRDARMGDRYTEYLDALEASGVGVLAHFTFCSGWSKWGSWGALEYMDQPIEEAPKHRALVEWIGVCFADFNGDGAVDFADVLALLASWGPCAECPFDLDGDGLVGVSDLLIVLGEWGRCGGGPGQPAGPAPAM